MLKRGLSGKDGQAAPMILIEKRKPKVDKESSGGGGNSAARIFVQPSVRSL